MRTMARAMLAAAVVAAALSASGCSTTRLVDVWRDPQFKAAPMKSLFVLCMRKDQGGRRMCEDGFVATLAARGLEATASYTVYPGRLPEEAKLREQVGKTKFAGLLVVSMLGKELRTRRVPGEVQVVPVGVYRDPVWGWYRTAWTTVYSPGYTEQMRLTRLEVSVYEARESGTLVWSGVSETAETPSRAALFREVADKVLARMATDGVI